MGWIEMIIQVGVWLVFFFFLIRLPDKQHSISQFSQILLPDIEEYS